MKYLALILTFVSFSIYSQTKYVTKTGSVNFEASLPAFEEVKASNNSVTAIIDSQNGEFAALVLIKGFRFKNALMEEHFNENYAESDQYPKATFKGIIIDFDSNRLNNVLMPFNFNGLLNFHGKVKQFDNAVIQISKSEDHITIKGNFKVNAADFDIKIPSIVKNKIANDIDVVFDFKLKKKY